jgi:hypothetical protein
MLVKSLPEMVKTLQAGVEEYYGLHATHQPPHKSEYDPPLMRLENRLGMNLFWAAFIVHSPTGKQMMRKEFQWDFVLADGNRVHRNGKTRDRGYMHEDYGIDTETELQSVEVSCQAADDDFLCFLRPFVKQRMPKVNVSLGRR